MSDLTNRAVCEVSIDGDTGKPMRMASDSAIDLANTLAAQNRAAGRSFEIEPGDNECRFTMSYPGIDRQVTGTITMARGVGRLTPEQREERVARRRRYLRNRDWERRNKRHTDASDSVAPHG